MDVWGSLEPVSVGHNQWSRYQYTQALVWYDCCGSHVRASLRREASWATMGQVCFTAISSKGTCPTVFIAVSSLHQIIVLCGCCPSVQWVGLRAKFPFLPTALYQVS